jgi:hypothetical protein
LEIICEVLPTTCWTPYFTLMILIMRLAGDLLPMYSKVRKFWNTGHPHKADFQAFALRIGVWEFRVENWWLPSRTNRKG